MTIKEIKVKSDFNQNVLTLITGTTIAQAIPIAVSPILTRINTPEDFGILSIFVAITAVFGSIANGRYELAIMLPKKDEDAINIFALGFIIVSCVSLVLLLLVVVFNGYFTTLLGNEEISFWLYFVPLVVFFTGLWNILNYFNNRRKNYKDLRNAAIIKSILSAIIQLSIGLIKQGPTGLISGQIFSQFFANTKLLKNIIKDRLLVSKIRRLKILALAKRYKDFPKHSMIPSFLNTLTSQYTSIMIPKMFSFAVGGYFFLAIKIVNLPATLISGAISQVYLQQISENKNRKIKNFAIFISTFKKLFLIALPISIIGYFLSPYIFPAIFGKDWVISGEVAKYLFLIFLITFCVSPLSVSFVPALELKKGAFWQYLYSCTSIVFFSISMYLELPLKDFLLFFVIHEYALYGIFLYLIVSSVKNMDRKIEN